MSESSAHSHETTETPSDEPAAIPPQATEQNSSIEIGNIENSQSIAIGDGASATHTTIERLFQIELLSGFNFGKYFNRKSIGLVVLTLTLLAISFRLSQPLLVKFLNESGLRLMFDENDLESAERRFLLATQLVPNSGAAYYNLGRLYQEIAYNELADSTNEYIKSLEAYNAAIERGDDFARNQAARLYILRGEPATAVRLLPIEVINKQTEPVVEYAMLKNLGWALIELTEWANAEATLSDAILLYERPDTEIWDGVAYCMRGYVAEQRQAVARATQDYANCQHYSATNLPEHMEWLAHAEIFLNTLEIEQ